MLCRRAAFLFLSLPRSTHHSLSKFRPLASTVSLSLHLTSQKRYSGTQSAPRLALPARIVSSLPPSIKPYAYLARLHAPVGSWLLYWPCGSLSRTLGNECVLTFSVEYHFGGSTCASCRCAAILNDRSLWGWRCRHAGRRVYYKRSLGQESG